MISTPIARAHERRGGRARRRGLPGAPVLAWLSALDRLAEVTGRRGTAVALTTPCDGERMALATLGQMSAGAGAPTTRRSRPPNVRPRQNRTMRRDATTSPPPS